MRNLTLLALALTGVALSACAPDSENEGSAESFTVVTPTGEERNGALRVALPEGISPSAKDVITIDGTPVSFGEWTLVGVGAHRLSVNGLLDSDVRVTADAPTTYTLSALKIKTPTTPTLGVNAPLDETPGDARNQIDLTIAGREGTAHVVAPSDGEVVLLPHAPDRKVTAAWGGQDGLSATLDDGAVTTLDCNRTEGRILVTLRAPARELSGGEVWKITWSGGGRASVRMPAAGALIVNARTRFIELTAGGGSTSLWSTDAVTVQLGRIDVKDVSLKTSSGAQVTVKGSVFLRYRDQVTKEETTTGPFPTESGVDVIPGKYTVETRYKTTTGAEQVDTQDVVVP